MTTPWMNITERNDTAARALARDVIQTHGIAALGDLSPTAIYRAVSSARFSDLARPRTPKTGAAA